MGIGKIVLTHCMSANNAIDNDVERNVRCFLVTSKDMKNVFGFE